MNNMSLQHQTSPKVSTPPFDQTQPEDDLQKRFIPLSDGRVGLRRPLELASLSIPDQAGTGEPVIDFVASSQALDRYEEIIVPTGWRLEHYRRNPVFQNAHQYGDVLFTLGKAQITEIREIAGRPALFQRIEFATDVNPMARIAYGLYRGKFLNAVSVGFIPVRWENGGPEAGYRRKYLEQELLEVSAVGIPANPEALQLGLQAHAIRRTDLEDLLDLLHGFSAHDFAPMILPSPFCSDPAATNTLAGAPGVPSNGAHLLRLARALREILRRT
jgi:phage head maturation protease